MHVFCVLQKKKKFKNSPIAVLPTSKLCLSYAQESGSRSCFWSLSVFKQNYGIVLFLTGVRVRGH